LWRILGFSFVVIVVFLVLRAVLPWLARMMYYGALLIVAIVVAALIVRMWRGRR
jgi:hypothetical protein